MIGIFNHKADELHTALMLDEQTKSEIIELCENYVTSLSVTVIMEKVQELYGVRPLVFASYILGQLIAINQNNLFNQNLIQCQRVN